MDENGQTRKYDKKAGIVRGFRARASLRFFIKGEEHEAAIERHSKTLWQ